MKRKSSSTRLNKVNSNIPFTFKAKKSGKRPFLDNVVVRNDSKLQADIYKKPPEIDCLLEPPSFHEAAQKTSFDEGE